MKYSLTIALLALLAAQAAAQTAQPGGGTAGSTMPAAKAKLSAQDRDFVKRAAIGGMAEVEEGKLPTQHAQSDAVKNFAQQMVTDHTKINADLQTIAGRIGVTPPATLDKGTYCDAPASRQIFGTAIRQELHAGPGLRTSEDHLVVREGGQVGTEPRAQDLRHGHVTHASQAPSDGAGRERAAQDVSAQIVTIAGAVSHR
jgi:predicted outer membrane protein